MAEEIIVTPDSGGRWIKDAETGELRKALPHEDGARSATGQHEDAGTKPAETKGQGKAQPVVEAADIKADGKKGDKA